MAGNNGLELRDVGLELLRYLEDGFLADSPIAASEINAIVSRKCPDMDIGWDRTADGLPLLHLAVMNEGTASADLFAAIEALLAHGAPLDLKDEDGDTALHAILSLEGEGNSPGEASEAAAPELCEAHCAALRALLRCQEQAVEEEDVRAIHSWLRRSEKPAALQAQVLEDLLLRCGAATLARVEASAELLRYLEDCDYNAKKGVESRVIAELLARGASPGTSQHKASALCLVVLNPYSRLAELTEVFRLMLTAEPTVIAQRDGFKLLPLQWAADYENVCQQHMLGVLNASTLLALFPVIIACVPREIDAGQCCLKVGPRGSSSGSHVQQQEVRPLRFLAGDRVVCRVEAPGGLEWEEGFVVGLWYRDCCWPQEHPGAPYEVKLDIGTRVFALVDDDSIIRPLTASQKAPKERGGPATGRFRKVQRADGDWELLDSKSGKARPCSPPDSDGE